MPSLSMEISLPWRDASVVSAEVVLPWRDAALVTSEGGPFWRPDAPPGSTATTRSLAATYTLPAAAGYDVVHVVTVTDLTDDAPIECEQLGIAFDDGSICWTLSATVPRDQFARVSGATPPVWEVSIDGLHWRFVVEGAARRRGEFGHGSVAITGRSLSMLAAEPYALPENWLNVGPASAAQLVDMAQAYTGLETRWMLDDWLVPDRTWTYTGTPMQVAQRVADAVGAVVRSDRAEQAITIEPRYRDLPNAWHQIPPDVEIRADAVLADSIERADRPAYTGVYVSGQQGGVLAFIRRLGTAGDVQAPYTTDLLITDTEAARQRGIAILGAAGPQWRVTMTLPVLTGGTYPGVLDPGMLCRVIERGEAPWWGVVRSVRVDAALPSVTQTVTLERHAEAPPVNTDPDIWRLRPTAAELQYRSAYEADLGGEVQGMGGVWAYSAIPPWAQLSDDGVTLTLRNDLPAFPPPYGISTTTSLGPWASSASPGWDPTPGVGRRSGVFACEVVYVAGGGPRDAYVGLRYYHGAQLVSAIVLHEAGVSMPHEVAGVSRFASPGLIVGDVVGFVFGVPLEGDTAVSVYLNGARLFGLAASDWPASFDGGLTAGGVIVGRDDPALYPSHYRV